MDRITTVNILGFSHAGPLSQERMKAVKNYIPQPKDSIAIFHEEFGYIGGACHEAESINLRKELLEH